MHWAAVLVLANFVYSSAPFYNLRMPCLLLSLCIIRYCIMHSVCHRCLMFFLHCVVCGSVLLLVSICMPLLLAFFGHAFGVLDNYLILLRQLCTHWRLCCRRALPWWPCDCWLGSLCNNFIVIAAGTCAVGNMISKLGCTCNDVLPTIAYCCLPFGNLCSCRLPGNCYLNIACLSFTVSVLNLNV